MLAQIVADTADNCSAKVDGQLQKPWLSSHCHFLLQLRRNENCRHERSRLSKLITRELRAGLRRWKTQKLQTQLEKFTDIKHSTRIHDAPSVGATSSNIAPQQFANSLTAVYKSNNYSVDWDVAKVREVPLFSIAELRTGLRKLASNKCGDEHGVVAEMLKYASELLHDTILQCFNQMLATGHFPDDWHQTVFKMLPKSGDLSSVDNWRPIAILPILYKLFSHLLFARIFPVLDQHQDDDQLGFRPGMRLENAFATLESLLSNCNECN